MVSLTEIEGPGRLGESAWGAGTRPVQPPAAESARLLRQLGRLRREHPPHLLHVDRKRRRDRVGVLAEVMQPTNSLRELQFRPMLTLLRALRPLPLVRGLPLLIGWTRARLSDRGVRSGRNA
ncbi:MAG: hypothetical protein OXP28_07185 [Gammaproteobacteria bacterium]|nr:hypothetical protein [Gammaproteobacteria bacterium]